MRRASESHRMMYEERTQERQSAVNDMLGTMAGIALTRGSRLGIRERAIAA